MATLTAPQPVAPAAAWPCLPGCISGADHTMTRPDRACTVQVGTVGADPSPLSVEVRRDLDTGALWMEVSGDDPLTYSLQPADALALAEAMRSAALALTGGAR